MTGRKAFEGSDIIDTLNKTIREPVVPLTGSRQGASSELQRIVRRCLAKDPDERYQSIKDVAIELKELGHGRKTGDHAVRDIKRHKFSAVFAVIVVASLVTAFVIYHHSRATPAAVHFQSVKLARLTADGNLESVAVSADGKYIAYSVEEGGKRSLWTKHLATASRVQIVPPAEVSLLNASTFSPDGGLVYYTKVDEQNPPGALYQVPVLGGSSKKVLADGAQPISISPDGKRLAFQRVRRTGTVDELFLANVDGSGEHRILAVPEPEWLVGGSPAWSPDGQSLATGYGDGKAMVLAAVSVADGKIRPITARGWLFIGSVGWLSDGRGIVFTAREQVPGGPATVAGIVSARRSETHYKRSQCIRCLQPRSKRNTRPWR